MKLILIIIWFQDMGSYKDNKNAHYCYKHWSQNTQCCIPFDLNHEINYWLGNVKNRLTPSERDSESECDNDKHSDLTTKFVLKIFATDEKIVNFWTVLFKHGCLNRCLFINVLKKRKRKRKRRFIWII